MNDQILKILSDKYRGFSKTYQHLSKVGLINASVLNLVKRLYDNKSKVTNFVIFSTAVNLELYMNNYTLTFLKTDVILTEVHGNNSITINLKKVIDTRTYTYETKLLNRIKIRIY